MLSTGRILNGMENAESAHTSPLSLDVETIDGVVVVHARGEVDVVTAPQMEQRLADAIERRRNRVVLADLSEVTFLASAGLAALVRCHALLPEGGRLLVVADGPATLRPLELTELTETFEVHSSVDAALSAV